MVWLALLLATGTVVFIAYPLVRPRLRAAEAAAAPEASELAAAKESTYAAIKELEFDYRAGSLSQEDYQDLESRYKRKAAAFLQAEDARQGDADRRARIEAEIRRLRSQPKGPAAIEEEIRRIRSSRAPQAPQATPEAGPPAMRRFCTQCGRPSDPGDRFCGNCGHNLSKTGSTE